jgi:hypothetical protein
MNGRDNFSDQSVKLPTYPPTDSRGFDQALGHAAGGGSAKFEIEGTQFTLKDLCLCYRANQQTAEQCR